MLKKLNLFTKSLLFIILILAFSSTHSIFAQNDIENSKNEQDSLNKYYDLDNILNPTVSVTLTGISLTGAAFLVNLSRNNPENIEIRIDKARKSFIKAFFNFLICTIILFIFDFIEILDASNIAIYTIIDVVITYAFFGTGAMFLINAAKHLFTIYRK